jgi:hypothetical protein
MAARPHRALWHLSPATGRNAKRPDAHRLSPFQSAHANATDRPELRGTFRRARPARALFRGSWGTPRSLAGEFGAARVHRCSKTSTRPLVARCSRAPSRPRALVRLLQVNALTSTTEDRSNIPNHRDEWLGRLPCSFESCPSKRGQSPELHEVRGREHRVSTLPVTIARAGDFAPTPIASGTSCRRHRSLPCPERRGEKAMPPPPAHACMARAALGPCDAGFPRRDPMFRSPRGLPSLGCFVCTKQKRFPRKRASQGSATAPFSPSRRAGEGRSHVA